MAENKDEHNLKKIFQKYNEENPHEQDFHNHISSHLEKFETQFHKDKNKDSADLHAFSVWGFCKETLKSIVIIVSLFLLFRGFVALPFQVDGQSMEPTLHSREFIYVDKLFPRIFGYERGQVIVFYPPYEKTTKVTSLMCGLYTMENFLMMKGKENPCEVQASYVKRIIGIAGDIVEIEDGNVFVTPKNGERQKVPEEFLLDQNQNATCVLEGTGVCSAEKRTFGPVPEGSFFVMGDNRTASSDSRAFRWKTPFVSQSEIFGVARFVYFAPPRLSGIFDLPKGMWNGILEARSISKEKIAESKS